MRSSITRRQVLKNVAAAAGSRALLGPLIVLSEEPAIRIAGGPVEIALSSVSPVTARVTIAPLENNQPQPISSDGALVRETWGEPAASLRTLAGPFAVKCGDLDVKLAPEPLTIRVEAKGGRLVQELKITRASGQVSFRLGEGPVLGMGEGGPQFDRRGSVDPMRSGQGGYQLRTHGGRVPVPWLIGTAGWAIFFHHPFGTFDLTGKEEGDFFPAGRPTPIDLFVVGTQDPVRIMGEYARLTGHPEMPPLWSLGYQQSHRTLASREDVLDIASTFRQKKLPSDALIYLGTGFCPSGWNTANGSFSWNRSVFDQPEEVLRQLHALNFKVVVHAVILSKTLRGGAADACHLTSFDEEEAGCYWDLHRKVFAQGVDGWWPDEGDPLDAASRLTRIRMYWEGPQLDQPNKRPYALHRNGYAGMQRYAAFLWSGDVSSTWETLRTHIAVAINTGLTGIPFWGTDTGGFVPTKELTAELYLRWFQFSAFCPLFRSHGRAWKLRLPWGWNTGKVGPTEISNYAEAALPDASELHNTAVEPICRKYLELRYRMMPYLYSAIRETHETGLPVMRALWLHYPQDAMAVSRGDEYLWGRDLLIAPVAEKGAASRRLYLPRGVWYDFWAEQKLEGGREISREVDLETMPIYARAGTLLTLGPVKQHTSELDDGSLEIWIYPGADGSFTLYEDDGTTFEYRRGQFAKLRMDWKDGERHFTARLLEGSRMLPPVPRKIQLRIVGQNLSRQVEFDGRPLDLAF